MMKDRAMRKCSMVFVCLGITFFDAAGMASVYKVSENFQRYEVLATFVYNFIGFTSWPINVKDVRICVTGADKVAETLQVVARHSKRRIYVINDATANEYQLCHMLYIGEDLKSSVDDLLVIANKYPVLTMSPIRDFVRRGGHIEFIVKSDQIGLKANIASLNRSGIVIDADLLAIMEISW